MRSRISFCSVSFQRLEFVFFGGGSVLSVVDSHAQSEVDIADVYAPHTCFCAIDLAVMANSGMNCQPVRMGWKQ